MMHRFLPTLLVCWLLLGGQTVLRAQDASPPSVDSVVVQGNQRLTTSQILGSAGIVLRQPINYR
ncbi:MAG TPA: hypothetical protein VD930_03705, partial [Gemmatimonadales bacterium]|nr:hypothetical protein [Gemmatimonadales bacterium]